jgi:hypothetical protein
VVGNSPNKTSGNQVGENPDFYPRARALLIGYEEDLVPFAAFLNSSTKRWAASASGGGAVLLESFGLVFESFDKAEHSKEQSYARCYVDG